MTAPRSLQSLTLIFMADQFVDSQTLNEDDW